MSKKSKNQYKPDYVPPPGEILLETLEERGMSQAELALRMARPGVLNLAVFLRYFFTHKTMIVLKNREAVTALTINIVV